MSKKRTKKEIWGQIIRAYKLLVRDTFPSVGLCTLYDLDEEQEKVLRAALWKEAKRQKVDIGNSYLWPDDRARIAWCKKQGGIKTRTR